MAAAGISCAFYVSGIPLGFGDSAIFTPSYFDDYAIAAVWNGNTLAMTLSIEKEVALDQSLRLWAFASEDYSMTLVWEFLGQTDVKVLIDSTGKGQFAIYDSVPSVYGKYTIPRPLYGSSYKISLGKYTSNAIRFDKELAPFIKE